MGGPELELGTAAMPLGTCGQVMLSDWVLHSLSLL